MILRRHPVDQRLAGVHHDPGIDQRHQRASAIYSRNAPFTFRSTSCPCRCHRGTADCIDLPGRLVRLCHFITDSASLGHSTPQPEAMRGTRPATRPPRCGRGNVVEIGSRRSFMRASRAPRGDACPPHCGCRASDYLSISESLVVHPPEVRERRQWLQYPRSICGKRAQRVVRLTFQSFASQPREVIENRVRQTDHTASNASAATATPQ